MTKWYNNYVGFPYKHLGEDTVEGIDCFNLCKYILRQECSINVVYSTSHFCNIVDDDWYQKTTEQLFEKSVNISEKGFGWLKVRQPKPFDILTMSIGSTNITNHCAMYVGDNKIIQVTIARPSYITIYGNYYKQYTTGIYRWNPSNN